MKESAFNTENWEKKQRNEPQGTNKVSHSLLDNFITDGGNNTKLFTPKQLTLPIFDIPGDDVPDEIAEKENDVKIFLDYEESQMCHALIPFLSKKLDENKNTIEKVGEALEDSKYLHKNELKYVPVAVSINELTKNYYGITSGKVHNSQKKRVCEELERLANHRVSNFLESDKGLYEARSRIVLTGDDLTLYATDNNGEVKKDKNGNKIIKEKAVEVLFHPVFYNNIFNKYVTTPGDYPKLRAKNQQKNPLFTKVESKLLKVIGAKIKSAKGKKADEKKVILSYKMSIEKILDLVGDEYNRKDRNAKRIDRIKEDMQKNREAFINMGLITDMVYKDGEFRFSLNENFTKREE